MVRGDLALPSPALLSAWRQLSFFFWKCCWENAPADNSALEEGSRGAGAERNCDCTKRGRARGENGGVSPVRGGWPRGRHEDGVRMPVRERSLRGKRRVLLHSVGGRHPFDRAMVVEGHEQVRLAVEVVSDPLQHPEVRLRAQNVIDEVKSIARGPRSAKARGLSTRRMRPSKRSSSCLSALLSSLPRRRRRRT